MVSENEHDYMGNTRKSHETVMKGGSRVCVCCWRWEHALPTPMGHCRKCSRVKRMKFKGGVRVLLMADFRTSRPPPDLPHTSKSTKTTFRTMVRDPLRTWQSLPRLSHRLRRPPILPLTPGKGESGECGECGIVTRDGHGSVWVDG